MTTSSKAGTVLALLLCGAGCTEFLSGPGLTENPNNPLEVTALQQLIAMQSNMATRLEGQIARCAGIYTQQLIGSNNQQLAYCTQYAVTESDISGQMSGFYTGGGLLALRNIQAAAQKSGDQFRYGIAKVWEGLAMGTATSVWGDLLTSHGSIHVFDANIWADFRSTRQDIVACDVLVQILKTRNDPRLAAYFDPSTNSQFVGADQNNSMVRPPGCPAAPATCAPSVINTGVRRVFTFRQPIVTWAENQLILAEAKYMTGDSAGAVGHVDPVRTAGGMPALGNVSFTDVMLEKYIAMYQNADVWSDYKRTCIHQLTTLRTRPEVLAACACGAAERT